MYLEMPDKNLRIENPSADEIIRELQGMIGTPNDDNCLDLCRHDGGFIQAIGCISLGFIIRFKPANGSLHQSREPLALQEVQSILIAHINSGNYPKADAVYEEIKMPSRRTLLSRLKSITDGTAKKWPL